MLSKAAVQHVLKLSIIWWFNGKASVGCVRHMSLVSLITFRKREPQWKEKRTEENQLAGKQKLWISAIKRLLSHQFVIQIRKFADTTQCGTAHTFHTHTLTHIDERMRNWRKPSFKPYKLRICICRGFCGRDNKSVCKEFSIRFRLGLQLFFFLSHLPVPFLWICFSCGRLRDLTSCTSCKHVRVSFFVQANASPSAQKIQWQTRLKRESNKNIPDTHTPTLCRLCNTLLSLHIEI